MSFPVVYLPEAQDDIDAAYTQNERRPVPSILPIRLIVDRETR